jgi:hydrogenase/urease accessory protein HupE
LGSPRRYEELATEAPDKQREDLKAVVPKVTDAIQLFAGQQRLVLELQSFTAAVARKADWLDETVSKHSTFRFKANLPPGSLKLVVPIGSEIDYPVAYTIQVPAKHTSMTRWLEEGMHESQPFEREQPNQLWQYLRLGFKHIVPEGIDHILFVLGLFFLGITWRKLISQTTVFTVAHATTLFLSTYGIFTLPSRYVEPAIALSIAVIALENVFRPKLGAERLAIVFGFGLVHGLGFASSLSDVPFPKHDFLVALLGFNFGVDFGQLFVIALAFLVVGWFRHKSWFRARVAIPCSLLIAAVGLFWAVERVVLYWSA